MVQFHGRINLHSRWTQRPPSSTLGGGCSRQYAFTTAYMHPRGIFLILMKTNVTWIRRQSESATELMMPIPVSSEGDQCLWWLALGANHRVKKWPLACITIEFRVSFSIWRISMKFLVNVGVDQNFCILHSLLEVLHVLDWTAFGV
jgi:hypothetical protein